ncbi:MAG: DNA primase [Phycisphaerae bacterium]
MRKSLKEKVLESVDLIDVVGERVRLTRKGKDFIGLCPFHADHNPSMYVSPTKQIFKCFSCGAGGDVIKFVQLRDRLEFRDAVAVLAQRAGIATLEDERGGPRGPGRDQLRQVLDWARLRFQRCLRDADGGRAALDYARRRGLSEESIERFGLGFAPDRWDELAGALVHAGFSLDLAEQAGLIGRNPSGKVYDRFRNRLMFPISDGHGRVVAFGGRTLGDDPAKYLNSPETPLFSKSRILFALDQARESITDAAGVIVVEGYTDAVLLHQHGFPNTVATLGTALTDAHVKVLKPLTERVYLCFDADQAGVKAADRALETALRNRVEVRVVVLRPGEDPADCVVNGGAALFSDKLRNAVDALEFKWSTVIQNLAGPEVRARRLAADAFLEFLAGVGAAGGIDPLELGLLAGRVSSLLGVPADAIYDHLSRSRAAARPQVAHNDALPIDERSSYDESVRGLPAGLVGAVEELFGWMITSPQVFDRAAERLVGVAGACEAWDRLNEICRDLWQNAGGFTKEEVLAQCDDALTCELVGRGFTAVRGVVPTEEGFVAALDRVASETDVLRIGGWRAALRGSDGEPQRASAFEALLDAARRQNGLLPIELRGGSTGGRN